MAHPTLYDIDESYFTTGFVLPGFKMDKEE